MRFLLLASLLSAATAFTTQPSAFSVPKMPVAEASEQSHRTRQATIVMDGKANGTFLRGFSTSKFHTYVWPGSCRRDHGIALGRLALLHRLGGGLGLSPWVGEASVGPRAIDLSGF